MAEEFHEKLKRIIHEYILLTYELTKKYPDDEKFGLISQDRRSSVSVMLNYVEGYARMKGKVQLNFFEISYGSLKESIYIKYLSKCLKYIDDYEYKKILEIKDEIGAMLYKTIEGLRKKIK